MTLHQKLFGMKIMAPTGDNDGSAGVVDRGDDYVAAEPAALPEATDEDVALATGETEPEPAEPARDAGGKFAKKEKDEAGAMIPKSRFDTAVSKERERAEAAERRLAEIAASNNQITRNADLGKLEQDVKALRAQERAAMVAGDEERAAALSEQADRMNRQIAITQAGDMSVAAKDQALESMRMELAVENIEENYPALDETSEEFDQDLTDDVLDKQRGYMDRERLSPSKALLKAVKYVMSRQAAPAEEPAKTGLSAAAKGIDRKAAAVGKNLDAAKRQPGNTKGIGADSDKFGQTRETPEADQMSYDEFSALPEATKAKMRGDFV